MPVGRAPLQTGQSIALTELMRRAGTPKELRKLAEAMANAELPSRC
jgi:hypothetical protein